METSDPSQKSRAEKSAGERERDLPWFVVSRRQEYAGELRANLLRLIGIAGFYAIELIHYHGLSLGFLELPARGDVTRDFHVAVTALAVAWTALGLGVQLALAQQVFPAGMKFLSTGADIVLLTSVLTLADGPRSPLIIVFFVILALSALRFSLPLMRFATVAAMAGYLFLSGFARWFTTRELRVPRYEQLIVLLAILLTGVVLGQVIRRVQTLAREYAGSRGREE